jgi:hypothetical protein
LAAWAAAISPTTLTYGLFVQGNQVVLILYTLQIVGKQVKQPAITLAMMAIWREA